VITVALTDRFPALAQEEVELLALLSEGSLGRAIRIAGGGGAALFAEIAGFLGAWPGHKIQDLHDLADRMVGRAGESVFELAREMLGWWFARFMRHAARRSAPERNLFPGEAALIQRMSGAISLARWMESWDKASLVFDRVRTVNMDRKQAWVGAMVVLSGEVC
jgi:DNA polymerase-3 subunit delta'